MGVAYPKRNDKVYYEQFAGTLESAQKCAKITGQFARIEINGEKSGWLVGDAIDAFYLGKDGHRVPRNCYVVSHSPGKWDILSAEQFDRNYLKESL